VGLDVTLQVRHNRDLAQLLLSADTPFAPFAGKATLAWIVPLARENPGSTADADSCAMHDPLALAVVTHPELVEFVDAHVSVVTGDGLARGVLVTDLLQSADPPKPNCRVAQSVDANGFTELFLGLISDL